MATFTTLLSTTKFWAIYRARSILSTNSVKIWQANLLHFLRHRFLLFVLWYSAEYLIRDTVFTTRLWTLPLAVIKRYINPKSCHGINIGSISSIVLLTCNIYMSHVYLRCFSSNVSIAHDCVWNPNIRKVYKCFRTKLFIDINKILKITSILY